MLPNSDVQRFLCDLAAVCATHGVTVIVGVDGKASAIMRGQPIDLTDGQLDRMIEDAMRQSVEGAPSPETFF